MRLTQFSDFALRVLLHAAVTQRPWLTVAETAAAFGGLSEDHVAKVVRELGHRGFLEVRRGRGGGFRLGRVPEEITVGEVVRATEPDFHVVECFDPDRNSCPIVSSCRLAGVLDDARDAFLKVLDAWSLADLLSRKRKDLAALLETEEV